MKSFSRFLAVNLFALFLALVFLEIGLRVAESFSDETKKAGEKPAQIKLFDEEKSGNKTLYSTRYTRLPDPGRGELIPLPDGRSFKILDPLPYARFALPKPDGVFRAFILGSSPIAGFDRIPRMSRLMSKRLSEDFEIIDLSNRGNSALEIGIALDRILSLSPDAVLVYPGGIAPDFGPEILPKDLSKSNNPSQTTRMLRKIRIFRLLGKFLGIKQAHAQMTTQKGAIIKPMPFPDDERLPKESFFPKPQEFPEALNPPERKIQQGVVQEVTRAHERFYLKAAKKVGAAGATFVFIAPTTNMSDFWPLLSYHKEEMSQGELKKWLSAYTAGTVMQDSGDCAGALREYDKALALDDRYAALWYRRGRCLLGQKRQDEAMESFQNALACDMAPERSLARPMHLTKQLETYPGAVVLDTEAELAKRIPGAAFGNDIFIDFEHFKPEAIEALADAVADLLIQLLILLQVSGQHKAVKLFRSAKFNV